MLTLVRMNRNSCPMLTPTPMKHRLGARSQVEAVWAPVRTKASPAVPAAMSRMPIWNR
jgi:hypothetical protein